MAVLLLGSGMGKPAQAHRGVDAARAAYGDGDYSIALTRLAEADRDPNLSLDDKSALLWTRALCHQAMGNQVNAVAAWDSLLALSPLYEPSSVDASPVQKAAFGQRQTIYLGQHGVTLDPPLLRGAAVRVGVGGHTEEVRGGNLFIRRPGQPTFRMLPMELDGPRGLAVTLRDDAWWASAPPAWEVVVEATNAYGAPMARSGDASAPLSLPVIPEAVEAARAVLHPPEPVPTPLPPVEAPPPPPPPPVHSWSTPWLTVGGLLAGASGLAVVAALALGAGSTASWAGLWLLPRSVGTDRSGPYNALYWGWLGLLGGAAVVGVAALALGGASVAGLVLAGIL